MSDEAKFYFDKIQDALKTEPQNYMQALNASFEFLSKSHNFKDCTERMAALANKYQSMLE